MQKILKQDIMTFFFFTFFVFYPKKIEDGKGRMRLFSMFFLPWKIWKSFIVLHKGALKRGNRGATFLFAYQILPIKQKLSSEKKPI